MYILRRKVFEVDLIDLCRNLHIFCHLRRRSDKGKFQFRVRGEFLCVITPAVQASSRRALPPHGVYLGNSLHYLKQPRPACDAICLQRRRDSQADRLLCPRRIRHNKVCF